MIRKEKIRKIGRLKCSFIKHLKPRVHVLFWIKNTKILVYQKIKWGRRETTNEKKNHIGRVIFKE